MFPSYYFVGVLFYVYDLSALFDDINSFLFFSMAFYLLRFSLEFAIIEESLTISYVVGLFFIMRYGFSGLMLLLTFCNNSAVLILYYSFSIHLTYMLVFDGKLLNLFLKTVYCYLLLMF